MTDPPVGAPGTLRVGATGWLARVQHFQDRQRRLIEVLDWLFQLLDLL